MRIASNRVSAIISYFHKELATLYPKEEIESFIFMCFEQYLNFKRTDLILKANDTVNESDLLKFSFAVKDLKREIPVQYVLGNAWFCELLFKVTPSVLIPRPETEELVQAIENNVLYSNLVSANTAKKSLNSYPSARLIMDIGTGSGCIAIALKVKLPEAILYAVDISAEALEIARFNSAYHKTEIAFLQQDILDASLNANLPYNMDIIVSNPPYVKQSEKKHMHKNVLDNEPHLALFVPDEDALKFYKAIVALAVIKLKEGGQLFFEINEALGEAVKDLLFANGFISIQVVKDINGKDRIVSGVLKT